MAKDNEGYEGVWRTIRGRRVFIRTGEELGSAMSRSGKFKNLKREDVVKGKQELENKGKELLDSYYDNPQEAEDISDLQGRHIEGYSKYLRQRNHEIPKELEAGTYTGGKEIGDYERQINKEYALNFGDSSQNYADTKDVPFSEKEKAVKENWSEADKYEYDLYKRAKENPDSIDPMTENSTDWEELDKKWSNRYDYDKEQEEFATEAKIERFKDRKEPVRSHTIDETIEKRNKRYEVKPRTDEYGERKSGFVLHDNETGRDIMKGSKATMQGALADREYKDFDAKAQRLGVNITEAPTKATRNDRLPYLSETSKGPWTRDIDMGMDRRDFSSPKDQEILDSVVGQLSDGIWENSPGMQKYWSNMDFGYNEDGRIIMRTGAGSSYNNPFAGKSDKQVRDYVANKVKQIVKIEMDDGGTNGEWDRNNTSKTEYLGYKEPITVADAYSVYDRLKGRKGKKYNTFGETSFTSNEVKDIKAQIERYKRRKNK